MVTVDPGIRARASDVAALTPVAMAANLDQLDLIPNGVRAYLTCGDDDARAFAGKLRRANVGARALFLNAPDALVLTGTDTPGGRASSSGVGRDRRDHGRRAPRAGDDRRRAVEVPDFDTGPVVDTTGGRDLLCAAFAWADLRGARPTSASAGRSSTRSSRWACRPRRAAPSPRSGCSRRGEARARPALACARLSRPTTGPAMAEVFLAAGRAAWGFAGEEALAACARRLRARRARRGGRGRASSASRRRRGCAVELLFTHPRAWGRGAGRALLAAGEDALRDAGCAEAALWTEERNETPAASTRRRAGGRTGRSRSASGTARRCASCATASGFERRRGPRRAARPRPPSGSSCSRSPRSRSGRRSRSSCSTSSGRRARRSGAWRSPR